MRVDIFVASNFAPGGRLSNTPGTVKNPLHLTYIAFVAETWHVFNWFCVADSAMVQRLANGGDAFPVLDYV